jgi:trans-2,3-dihydro-3-hydroxyanthranilate isomerase
MAYRFHIADVFTDTPFGGNQLAVVADARGLSDARMATIAREFNFSETIFIFPPDDPSHTRKVRIFTPGSELPFAGHPTVGVAHVMAATGIIELTGDETRIVLEEGVGPVPVLIRSRNGQPYFCQLTSARLPAKDENHFDPAEVAAVVSLSLEDLDLSDGLAVEAWSAGVPYLLIPVRTLDALGRARIWMPMWERHLKGTTAPEVFLFTRDTTAGAGEPAYRARMFAPTLGIAEDPATGSACAAFGGYFAARSAMRDGTLEYSIMQGVEMGRPSLIKVEVDMKNSTASAVRVGGATVLIATGDLHAG